MMGFMLVLLAACAARPVVSSDTADEGTFSSVNRSTYAWPTMAIRHQAYVCERSSNGKVSCHGRIDIDHAAIENLPPVEIIATGQNHTCVLTDIGSVWCWGSNKFGQLGDPNEHSEWRITPKQVPGITNATFVGADGNGSCAVIQKTSIRCWGVLGDAIDEDPIPPTEISSLPGTAAAYIGWEHACALRDEGTVYCWGSNAVRQLGRTDIASSATPIAVPGVSDAVYLAVGHHHSCVLHRDATVSCWGSSQYGQLGANGMSDGTASRVWGLTDVVALELGDANSCALRTNKTVWCWGWNELGQLGIGTTENKNVPSRIDIFHAATALAVSDAHACAKRFDDSIWCWGEELTPDPRPIVE